MSRRAAACLVLALIVWAGAFRSGWLHDLDAALLLRMTSLEDTPLELLPEAALLLIKLPVYALLCAAVVAWALRTGGARAALAAGAAILGANVTTQLLKPGLAEPRFHPTLETQIAAASWPSGHATAAAVVALTALLAAPPARRRAVAAIGAVATAAVAAGVLVFHWHYPSDVLGGFAVAGAWAAAAAAWISSRRPARAPTAARRRRWLRATG